jgi:ubiquinone/menaquinone biosynthesis C-methylase UbiE
MFKLKPLIDWSPSRYDNLSKNYDLYARLFFPIGDEGRDKVLSGLESGRILDIACGTGVLLTKARAQGLDCIGMDNSWGMLQETRKKEPNMPLVQASFYELPFVNDCFDYVLETNAVSGVDIEAEKVLEEMIRTCNKGGEIRLGDYGRSKERSWWFRLLEGIGILFGDFPHDYKKVFDSLGYQAEVEELGWGGMYQLIILKL